ncbi:hypothetical protein Ancab_004136 [Ancistrocladus abbreviatus]
MLSLIHNSHCVNPQSSVPHITYLHLIHPKPLLASTMHNPSFKFDGSSRLQSTATIHAVHQNNGSVEHEEFACPIVSYSPCCWGDRFSNYKPDDETTQAIRKEEVEKLKGKVKEQLLATRSDQLHWLNYVNTLELLGVAYHFNNEIDEGLQYIYENYDCWGLEDNLYHVSLGFRLLRQHGFHMPNDIFKKFKNEKDCFKESITADVDGMLALFEASHVRMHGETILEEALDFTTTHLKSMVTQVTYPLATQVNHALERPLHRFTSRLDHRNYILVYETDPFHDKALLKFAKLNFNMVQSMHKKELSDLTSWWKGKNLASELPFARNRMVELYYYYTVTLFEPQYSTLRIALCKASGFVVMIDDIYDGYGTIEELELFTEAFERWDKNCINQLPYYMKSIYTSLLDTFEEAEQVLAKEGRSNCIEHIRETMKVIIHSYFQDAKWRLGKCNPTYEEYLTNAITSIAYGLVTIFCFIFLGEIATAEVFEWASRFPKPLKACNGITRLLNDMSIPSKQRDGMLSTIINYMKHFNVSEEEAIKELCKQVDDFWKDLNQEMLHPKVIPMPIINCLIRLSRSPEIAYRDGYDPFIVDRECYKDDITKLFIDPLAI